MPYTSLVGVLMSRSSFAWKKLLVSILTELGVEKTAPLDTSTHPVQKHVVENGKSDLLSVSLRLFTGRVSIAGFFPFRCSAVVSYRRPLNNKKLLTKIVVLHDRDLRSCRRLAEVRSCFASTQAPSTLPQQTTGKSSPVSPVAWLPPSWCHPPLP